MAESNRKPKMVCICSKPYISNVNVMNADFIHNLIWQVINGSLLQCFSMAKVCHPLIGFGFRLKKSLRRRLTAFSNPTLTFKLPLRLLNFIESFREQLKRGWLWQCGFNALKANLKEEEIVWEDRNSLCSRLIYVFPKTLTRSRRICCGSKMFVFSLLWLARQWSPTLFLPCESPRENLVTWAGKALCWNWFCVGVWFLCAVKWSS